MKSVAIIGAGITALTVAFPLATVVGQNTGLGIQHGYPDPLRRIGYRGLEIAKGLVFLVNN